MLLASREDILANYDEKGFKEAFDAYFRLHQRTELPGSKRTIYLMSAR